MPKQREHRRAWTKQEDDMLRQAVELQMINNKKPQWKKVATQLQEANPSQFPRNPKQCRERWYNALDPNVTGNKEWGLEEDIKLLRACKQIGHRWSKLVAQFDNKISDNRLKNHFYSNLRKFARHLNHLIKESKQQYNTKKRNQEQLSQEYSTLMKEITKIRTFDIKLLTKVFNLIDSKQEYKYEAKQTIDLESVEAINHAILEFIEDFLAQTDKYSDFDTLKLIWRILLVNRSIKTKYTRESKMSMHKQEEIIKATIQRKKKQKKINNIIKEELDKKIIPDKKTKEQILEKIKKKNKKASRLLSGPKHPVRRISNIQIQHQNNLNEVKKENQPPKNQCPSAREDIYQSQNSNYFMLDISKNIQPDFPYQNDNMLAASIDGYFENQRKNSMNSQEILQSSFHYYNNGSGANSGSKVNFGSLIQERSGHYQMKDESDKRETSPERVLQNNGGQMSNNPFKSSFLNCIKIVEKPNQKFQNKSQKINTQENPEPFKFFSGKSNPVLENFSKINESQQGFLDFNQHTFEDRSKIPGIFSSANLIKPSNKISNSNTILEAPKNSGESGQKESGLFSNKNNNSQNLSFLLVQNPFAEQQNPAQQLFNSLDISRQISVNSSFYNNNRMLQSRGFEPYKPEYDFQNDMNDNNMLQSDNLSRKSSKQK